jgi:hypothetical protein
MGPTIDLAARLTYVYDVELTERLSNVYSTEKYVTLTTEQTTNYAADNN